MFYWWRYVDYSWNKVRPFPVPLTLARRCRIEQSIPRWRDFSGSKPTSFRCWIREELRGTICLVTWFPVGVILQSRWPLTSRWTWKISPGVFPHALYVVNRESDRHFLTKNSPCVWIFKSFSNYVLCVSRSIHAYDVPLMIFTHIFLCYWMFFSETPNNDFGKDSVPYSRYVQVFQGKGLSNVDINKIVSKDVCNHDTRVNRGLFCLIGFYDLIDWLNLIALSQVSFTYWVFSYAELLYLSSLSVSLTESKRSCSCPWYR